MSRRTWPKNLVPKIIIVHHGYYTLVNLFRWSCAKFATELSTTTTTQVDRRPTRFCTCRSMHQTCGSLELIMKSYTLTVSLIYPTAIKLFPQVILLVSSLTLKWLTLFYDAGLLTCKSDRRTGFYEISEKFVSPNRWQSKLRTMQGRYFNENLMTSRSLRVYTVKTIGGACLCLTVSSRRFGERTSIRWNKNQPKWIRETHYLLLTTHNNFVYALAGFKIAIIMRPSRTGTQFFSL